MYKTLLATWNFNKSAELHDAFHLPLENIANLHFSREVPHKLYRLVELRYIFTSYKHLSGFFDVNLYAVFIGNAVDGFSARPDKQADFFWVNIKCGNFGRPLGKLRPRLR